MESLPESQHRFIADIGVLSVGLSTCSNRIVSSFYNFNTLSKSSGEESLIQETW